MIFYELKISYTRQTGEDNPTAVKESYLVEGLTCSDVEARMMENIQRYISGDSEIKSCKQVQFYDLLPNAEGEFWYKARVEMITIEESKETRKAVSIYVQASNVAEALKALNQALAGIDCEVISIAKSPIVEVFRAIN